MTIIDVAERAGVSKSTVSRVINGRDIVRPELVRRVREAMDALNFRPSARRRGPKPRMPEKPGLKTKRLGVLLYGHSVQLLDFPYIARFMSSFGTAAQAKDLRTEILQMPNPGQLPPAVRYNDVDGIVVLGVSRPLTADIVDQFSSIPSIWVGGAPVTPPLIDQIVNDARATALLALDYLAAKQKCADIAFINHDGLHTAFQQYRSMVEESAARRGLDCSIYELRRPSFTEQKLWSYERIRPDFSGLVDRMLADRGRPAHGIFVPTDQQAAMVHTLLRERGFVPGKDFTTISVNNDEPWLATLHPRPATIDMRPAEQGEIALNRLLERILDPLGHPQVTFIPPTLKLPPKIK